MDQSDIIREVARPVIDYLLLGHDRLRECGEYELWVINLMRRLAADLSLPDQTGQMPIWYVAGVVQALLILLPKHDAETLLSLYEQVIVSMKDEDTPTDSQARMVQQPLPPTVASISNIHSPHSDDPSDCIAFMDGFHFGTTTAKKLKNLNKTLNRRTETYVYLLLYPEIPKKFRVL